jgi:NADPH2 dehydrogenase
MWPGPEVSVSASKITFHKEVASMYPHLFSEMQVVDVPVIAAGRLGHAPVAEKALTAGQADLIGLARGLWADPEWPRKIREGREDAVIACDPKCGEACMHMVMKGRPAFCVAWPPEKMKAWRAKFR